MLHVFYMNIFEYISIVINANINRIKGGAYGYNTWYRRFGI